MNLERVLEPEVMDTAEEARDYNDMDHADVNRAFVEDLLATIGKPSAGKLRDVLDMGTGTALIPIELCRQSEGFRVMAIDMAVAMLDLARYNVEAAGMLDQITLAQADAKQLGFEDGMFDVVMSNSIVHHIPDPRQCLAEMHRVTAPGGWLFVRDLYRPDDLQTLESLVATYAGQENEHSRQMFRESLHAALTLAEIREMVGELGYPAESVQMNSDRHWTWAAQRP